MSTECQLCASVPAAYAALSARSRGFKSLDIGQKGEQAPMSRASVPAKGHTSTLVREGEPL